MCQVPVEVPPRARGLLMTLLVTDRISTPNVAGIKGLLICETGQFLLAESTETATITDDILRPGQRLVEQFVKRQESASLPRQARLFLRVPNGAAAADGISRLRSTSTRSMVYVKGLP